MGSITGEKAKYWGWCREELRSVLNKSPWFSHLRSHREGTRDRKVGRGDMCPGLVQRHGEMCLIVKLAQRLEGGTFALWKKPASQVGLISIWGPSHLSDHDGAVGSCGGRFSSHGEKGEAELKARGAAEGPPPSEMSLLGWVGGNIT